MLRAVRSLAVGFALLAPAVQAGPIELLSKADPESDTATGFGPQAIYHSPTVSADGRWIAFDSHGVNLAAGQRDGNASSDVFLHDRQTGTTLLVSHASGSLATTANGSSAWPSISDDGRWIVYTSTASDLVPGQVASFWRQVFLYDRETGTNALVSNSTAGATVSANSESFGEISGDGNWIVFTSYASDLLPGQIDPQGSYDVFLQERATGQRVLVSHATGTAVTTGNNHSHAPSISDDGRWVAFVSQASNLIPGYVPGPGFAPENVFLFDRVAGTVTLVSRTSASALTGAGGWYPDVSPDGAFVAFPSEGTNLVTGQTDTAGTWDLFLFDRATGTNRLVSHTDASLTTSAGAYFFGDFQAAAGHVVYRTPYIGSPARTQILLYRVSDASLTLVSRSAASPAQGANESSQAPRITPDGAFVVFQSQATDLVAGQGGPATGNAYLFDLAAGTVALASGAGGSAQVTGNSASTAPQVSDDGSLVAYTTFATDLAAGKLDLNATVDVALYDRDTATLSLATLHAPGQASATPSWRSALVSASADRRYAVLLSPALNLVPGQVDANHGRDVFLVDRVAGTTTLVSHAAGLPATAADGESLAAAISADGAYVAFLSRATDLVPGQVDTNVDFGDLGAEVPGSDVFLYDRAAGTTTLVSHVPGSPVTAGDRSCLEEFSLSSDGRHLAFLCQAANLVAGQSDANQTSDLFLYDRVANASILVSRKAGTAATAVDAPSWEPRISGDGRWISFVNAAADLIAGATDTNLTTDLFLFDRQSGQMLLVSRAAGTAATAADQGSWQGSLSPDGRYVVFPSTGTNLVPGQTGLHDNNVFLFDRVTGVVELISRAAGTATTTVAGANAPSVSDDGRYVAFRSTGTNLVPGQTAGPGAPKLNVFVHDRVTRQTELISRSAQSPSRTSNGDAEEPVLSPDGRWVAFLSKATDLAPAPAGRSFFLADRQLRTLERVAEGPDTDDYLTATDPQELPFPAADGSVVLFTSGSPDLAVSGDGDYNGADDVFAWVRSAPGAGDFFTVAPCRLIDTRQAGQGPALVSGVPALVRVRDVCGIPSAAKAVALNVTVLQAQGSGRLTLHPGNLSAPGTSTLNFQAGQTLANNAILPLASNGEGTLGVTPIVSGGSGGGTVHVLIDVSGWFE